MSVSALLQHVKASTAQLVNFALPPVCGLCQGRLDHPGALCADCWRQLHFLAEPYCDACGLPFSMPVEGVALCAACLTAPPLFTKARAALVYDDVCRQLISRFKYGDQLHLLPVFLPWLERAVQPLRPDLDLIVPVPLHWQRLWSRRYNQAGLLAARLGQQIAVPVAQQALQRRKATARQVGMTRTQRQKNVHKAFAVRQDVRGQTILLVDDVYTTGATLEACTQVLMDSGAKEVRVLTLARVARPEQVD